MNIYKRDIGKSALPKLMSVAIATVDDNDFLSNSKTIESLIGIKCVDPIYIPNEFDDVVPR